VSLARLLSNGCGLWGVVQNRLITNVWLHIAERLCSSKHQIKHCQSSLEMSPFLLSF
jgi:hypothetical protein